jgi:hypothetical protein
MHLTHACRKGPLTEPLASAQPPQVAAEACLQSVSREVSHLHVAHATSLPCGAARLAGMPSLMFGAAGRGRGGCFYFLLSQCRCFSQIARCKVLGSEPMWQPFAYAHPIHIVTLSALCMLALCGTHVERFLAVHSPARHCKDRSLIYGHNNNESLI